MQQYQPPTGGQYFNPGAGQGAGPYSPGQYTFVPGFGFIRRSPEDDERAQLLGMSRRLALTMLGCVGLMLLLTVPMSSLAVWLLRALPLSYSRDAANLLTGILVYLPAQLLPFALYRAKTGIPMRVALPFAKPRRWLVVCGILIFLAVNLVGTAASTTVEGILMGIGLSADTANPPLPADAPGAVLYFLLYVVLSPVLEELAFRGVVMQTLRRFGDGFALIASSLLFALMHTNVAVIPYAFLSALVIGYFVLRSGSLVTGIALHLANNLLSVLYDAAVNLLPVSAHALLGQGYIVVLLAAGLAAVIYALRRDSSLFCLAPPQTVLLLKRRLHIMLGSGVMIVFYLVTLIIMLSNLSVAPPVR